MIDLIRLMSDDPAVYTKPVHNTRELAVFTVRGKTWRALHIENPREYSGRGWFLHNGKYPSGRVEPGHSLDEFLASPTEYATKWWGTSRPGWTMNGKFTAQRFEPIWTDPTFVEFEEVT